MNRKRLLLAALAGLLLLSLIYAFWATPRQEKAPPRAETTRPAAKKSTVAGKKAPPPADRLHLGLLAQEPQKFPGAARDIFRFRGEGVASAGIPEEATAKVEEVEPPPPPPPPPPPTTEELLRGVVTRLVFLGYLDKAGERTVFLSGGGEIFLVKAGDAFGKDKFLVAKEITDKELVVGWNKGPEVIRVKLAENERLTPTMMTTGAATATQGAASGAPRPGAMSLPPRRGILPQRAAIRPPPSEPENNEQDGQPPSENVTQEEPPQQEPPGGEGNDDK